MGTNYRARRTAEERAAIAREALRRIQASPSLSNYAAVIQAFADRGIPESEINPKENCFTYTAWLGKARQVRRGEHGVKITVWIPASDDPEDNGRRPVYSTVFHVSQTDAVAR